MQSFGGDNLSRSCRPRLDRNEQGTKVCFKLFKIVSEADKCRVLVVALPFTKEGLIPD